MTSIAIVGPGAVGGIVAAWLARNAALSVTLCARTPFADLRVETPGGVIVGVAAPAGRSRRRRRTGGLGVGRHQGL